MPADTESSEKRFPRSAVIAAIAALAIGIAVAAVAIAADPSPAVPRSFYGVVSQSPLTDEDLDRMGDGQVGTVRMLVSWQSLDPSALEGDTDWSQIDPIIAGAARNGIEPLPFVFGTPDWVAHDLDRRDCAEDCLLYPPHSDDALAQWQGFLGEAVARYGPGGEFWSENPALPPMPVTTWQIWNEQNSPTFWQPEVDVGDYATLLEASAEAIRDRDRDAEIILGGMFGTPYGGKPPGMTAWGFLDQLYDTPGADGNFDGIAPHPYSARLEKVERQVRLMRDEMVEAGDSEGSVWVTEIGWSSAVVDNPLARGPEGQADLLREAMDYFLEVRESYRIENVTWFAWRDLAGKPICDWCAQAGLFAAEALTAKPAWQAFVAYTGGV